MEILGLWVVLRIILRGNQVEKLIVAYSVIEPSGGKNSKKIMRNF